jgi:hypothetical protein
MRGCGVPLPLLEANWIIEGDGGKEKTGKLGAVIDCKMVTNRTW